MRTVQNGAASIQLDTWGDGPPILALAPGGLRGSRNEAWANAPFNPLTELSDTFQMVGMNQRNTGTSTAPITADDGWSTYVADQLAVMDELGHERFGVIGMCIGGPFITRMIKEAPGRVIAAVALQPIGFDDNLDAFRSNFDAWRDAVGADHPEADDAVWEAVFTNLYGTRDIQWSVTDADLEKITTPLLVAQGSDPVHPALASTNLVEHTRNSTLIETWKEGEAREAAIAAIRSFFTEHLTP